jgi:hypothetical protein
MPDLTSFNSSLGNNTLPSIATSLPYNLNPNTTATPTPNSSDPLLFLGQTLSSELSSATPQSFLLSSSNEVDFFKNLLQ